MENTSPKKDFFIQVASLKDLGYTSQFEKSGKLESKDEIKLSSQANGRVDKILVKNGDSVNAGQILVTLKDTVGNYKENVEKSNNTLEKMRINYDSTKISLDKQIFDAQINLEKLQKNLETLKTGSSIDISQAQENLANTSYTSMDSKSALELQKLNDAITKAENDYANTLSSNKETIAGFKNTTKKEYVNITNLADDIGNF